MIHKLLEGPFFKESDNQVFGNYLNHYFWQKDT